MTEDMFAHMLADIDQIVTEMELDYEQRRPGEWIGMLRRAVDGTDYR